MLNLFIYLLYFKVVFPLFVFILFAAFISVATKNFNNTFKEQVNLDHLFNSFSRQSLGSIFLFQIISNVIAAMFFLDHQLQVRFSYGLILAEGVKAALVVTMLSTKEMAIPYLGEDKNQIKLYASLIFVFLIALFVEVFTDDFDEYYGVPNISKKYEVLVYFLNLFIFDFFDKKIRRILN